MAVFKATRMLGTISRITGGVATGPLAPVGFVVGMVGGYYGGKKIAEEKKCRQHWFASIEACLKSSNKKSKDNEKEDNNENEYVLVQSEVLMQMRLSVHCKKYLEKSVKSVRVGVKGQGWGNVVGNKGGIMVEIQFYGGESIAFLGCHCSRARGEDVLRKTIGTIRAIIGSAWRDKIEKRSDAKEMVRVGNIRLQAVEASGLMSGEKNSNDKNSNMSNIDRIVTTERKVDEEEQKKQRRLPPDLELLESATLTFHAET